MKINIAVSESTDDSVVVEISDLEDPSLVVEAPPKKIHPLKKVLGKKN